MIVTWQLLSGATSSSNPLGALVPLLQLKLSIAFGFTATKDAGVGPLAAWPGSTALGLGAGGAGGLTSSLGPSLAAAQRVAGMVLGDATNLGPASQPPVSPRLAQLDVLVIRIAELPDRRPTFKRNLAQLPGG